MKRARYSVLYRYISGECLISFSVAFAFFFFIFFVNNLLLLAEDILSKSVPVFEVVLLLIFTFPTVMSFSFPFASLLGALMAIGHFASTNEIMAMRASGISRFRIFLPIGLLGIAISLTAFVVQDYFLPASTLEFGKLYQRLLFSNPALELEPHSVRQYQDNIIITGGIDQAVIDNIVIIEPNPNDTDRRVISAQRATLEQQSEAESSGVLSLTLEGVFSQSIDQEGGTGEDYQYFTARRMDYNILLRDITSSIQQPGPREMRILDVYRTVRMQRNAQLVGIRARATNAEWARAVLYARYLRAAEQVVSRAQTSEEIAADLLERYENIQTRLDERPFDRNLRIYRIELNKKFSLPFACVFFILFAFPVGSLARRSGRTVGFGIGLFMSVIYWCLFIGGQTIGVNRMNFSPLLAMWIPNFSIALLGIGLTLLPQLRR